MSDAIKDLGDGKFKIQIGKFLTTYSVDAEGKISILDKDGSPKSFVFVDSDIETVYGISLLIKVIVKEVRKSHPREEIEINGQKYALVEDK